MQLEPTLDVARSPEIVLMGGNAFVGGNASPAAEANILNDPEAADIVFGADCPIVMAGLDVTEQTMMTVGRPRQDRDVRQPTSAAPGRDHARSTRASTASASASRASASTTRRPSATCWRRSSTRGSSIRYGSTSATASVAARRRPAIHVSDHETAWNGRRAVRILTGVDSRAVVELELERLAR